MIRLLAASMLILAGCLSIRGEPLYACLEQCADEAMCELQCRQQYPLAAENPRPHP